MAAKNTESKNIMEQLSEIGNFKLNVRVRTGKGKEVSPQMHMLSDVTVSFISDSGEEVFMIRGALKHFLSQGTMQLDFTNTRDARYPNAKLGESISKYISTATVGAIYNSLTDRNLGGLTQSFKIVNGKIIHVKEAILTNEEALGVAKEFLANAVTYEMRKPKEENTVDQGETDSDEEAAKQILNQ